MSDFTGFHFDFPCKVDDPATGAEVGGFKFRGAGCWRFNLLAVETESRTLPVRAVEAPLLEADHLPSTGMAFFGTAVLCT